METMIESVNSLLDGATVPDNFIESVLERLKSFGVNVTEDDTWLIAFSIRYTHNTICNECNISEIPDGLFSVAVDIACGEYMNTAKSMCKLHVDNIDLTGAITQIKEGDTSITFDASASDESKLSAFINYLLHGRKGELVCYRKMYW